MAYSNPYFDPTKPHHTKTGFINKGINCYTGNAFGSEKPLSQAEPIDEHCDHKQADVKKWQKNRKANKLPLPPKQGYEHFILNWLQTIDLSGQNDAIWWLGHASIMLRISGRIILIDPVLSDRISPVSFWGPKRMTPAPITVNALPKVDMVLISHNHYDHLDKQTITAIAKSSPNVEFYVPLGLKNWFQAQGISRITELDWWDEIQLDWFSLTFTPAKHWSVRTLFDKNRSLWGGFVIKVPGFSFYFSGDSAYSPSLHSIYDNLGPFDLVCLPIGAYLPRWFMNLAHMDPADAVKLYQYFGQPKVIPIHWGVFELGDESLDEPPIELKLSLKEAGLVDHRFEPFKIGQRLDLNSI